MVAYHEGGSREVLAVEAHVQPKTHEIIHLATLNTAEKTLDVMAAQPLLTVRPLENGSTPTAARASQAPRLEPPRPSPSRGLNNIAMEFFNSTAVMEAFVDDLVCAVSIYVAVIIGLLIGWSWRPRWSGLVSLGLRSKLRYVWTMPPGLGAWRFWLAFTALSAFSLCRGLWFRSPHGMSGKVDKSSADSASDSAQKSFDNALSRYQTYS
ncbi:hypothetical protein SASPL_129910 [Salvia splendens]|uniref:Uncharacterized protein n=1 Tax=Salvia splendens TaxID=180675 RepID=A0A8X8XI37_SALSN|nr:hypothetical protein SASPL_129910 [Salvia splendens]